MAELVLKSQRFRAEREADWRRLEALLAKAEGGSAARLSREELLELPVLYRSALSSLSVARSISLDQGLIDYLESLCTRAYFFVYGARSTLLARMGGFFTHDWPAAVKGLWRETLVSLAITLLGVVVAAALVAGDPDWFYAFVPSELAGGRDPSASAAFLRATLYDDHDGKSVFATFLFTHNAQVALFAFALGFALCLPTAGLMIHNGLMLGAFLALFASHGLGLEAGGWLMIHGATELFAIVLAGAAGFSIGWAVVFPGETSRMSAAAAAGRRAAVVMIGVVVMLFLAGLLEGIGRQAVRADALRWTIAAASLSLWLAYFYLPRKTP
ncbi:MAG: stage II sporulation protein M [Phenylobacterium sp.]|jgi:uncharacterized membrane protein SpoIIM required for sporulation|uniref:stage II sporulation protein M n=1 Tax=Phenylobacterium sp. TaxID=1871053 RepID=UPI002A3520FC|nr:stage II sporulation protein M [Phenylobacterium sp.]MDD3836954.1 stage II sporulation protein M [Phenylobacterium sp.]MDX9999323.1 stage II sporulation protein M [Phenylobacterium sp.]